MCSSRIAERVRLQRYSRTLAHDSKTSSRTLKRHAGHATAAYIALMGSTSADGGDIIG
jgi:hypothetical protein